MDLGGAVIFVVILAVGALLGTGLSVARPRDEEAAAMHRRQATRARVWLRAARRPDRVQPRTETGVQP